MLKVLTLTREWEGKIHIVVNSLEVFGEHVDVHKI